MVRLYGVFMLFLAFAGLGGGVLMALRGVLWVSILFIAFSVFFYINGMFRVSKK